MQVSIKKSVVRQVDRRIYAPLIIRNDQGLTCHFNVDNSFYIKMTTYSSIIGSAFPPEEGPGLRGFGPVSCTPEEDPGLGGFGPVSCTPEEDPRLGSGMG
jgi:hypothetical protein